MDLPWFRRVFQFFFRFWMKSRIEALRLRVPAGVRAVADRGAPVILAANHMSWWDGFLLAELHRVYFCRYRLAIAMSTREWMLRRWMRWLGTIPLDSEKRFTLRKLIRSLRGASARGPLCVFYFPQGHLWPVTRRPLEFHRGIEGVVRTIPGVVVVPVSLQFSWGSSFRPIAWVSCAEPMSGPEFSAAALEARVARELDGVTAFLDAEGEHAHEKSPAVGFAEVWSRSK